MDKFKSRVLEIEQSIEVVRKLLVMFVNKLEAKNDVGFSWIKEDLEQLLGLLNKYVELLVKLKREFSDVMEDSVDEDMELIWDIRLLEIEDKEKVREFVKGLLKEKYGGK